MTKSDLILFPAGTPVLIVGFPEKDWEFMEAYAYNHQLQPKGAECGTLVEPFRAGSPLYLNYAGATVGIKALPDDRVVAIESMSKERLVSIERKKPDEYGMQRYLVVQDATNLVRDLTVSHGFMCGSEPKLRISEEVKRIFLNLPLRTF